MYLLSNYILEVLYVLKVQLGTVLLQHLGEM